MSAVVVPIRKPKRVNGYEELFAFQLKNSRLPAVVREYRFAKEAFGRKWLFDFAFVDQMVAVEIEGLVVKKLTGQWACMGRHASPTGIKDDMEKYNHAVLLGWSVLRFDQKQIKPGTALDFTHRVLVARGWNDGRQ